MAFYKIHSRFKNQLQKWRWDHEMMLGQRITAKEAAEILGISESLFSKCLTGHAKISSNLLEKIKQN